MFNTGDQMNTKHQPATPLPWRLAPVSEYIGTALNIDAGKLGYIAEAGHRGDDQAEQNAAYIAHAANAYPKLVEALRFNISYHEDSFAGTPQGEPDWLKSQRALLRELGESE